MWLPFWEQGPIPTRAAPSLPLPARPGQQANERDWASAVGRGGRAAKIGWGSQSCPFLRRFFPSLPSPLRSPNPNPPSISLSLSRATFVLTPSPSIRRRASRSLGCHPSFHSLVPWVRPFASLVFRGNLHIDRSTLLNANPLPRSRPLPTRSARFNATRNGPRPSSLGRHIPPSAVDARRILSWGNLDSIGTEFPFPFAGGGRQRLHSKDPA